MAVDWGAWEYSGGNGMRVGIEIVSVSAVSNTSSSVTWTVAYWTDNQYSYSDSQSMNLGGHIDGTISYSNNQGASAVKRGTRTHTYTYSTYGSSPGTRTFTASVSGAYNGVTPSNSVTVTIPARPYAAPALPSAPSSSRVSDTQVNSSWTNYPTAGKPYTYVWLDRWTHAYQDWTRVATLAGTATSHADTGAVANRKYQYRTASQNSVGATGYSYGNNVWTTPAAATSVTRTDSGADQVITWVNNVSYPEAQHEIWRAAGGVWESSPLATVSASTTSYTDTAPSAAVAYKYRIRTVCTGNTALTATSSETTETPGITSAPNAPTALSPSGPPALDPAGNIDLTWTHNPTDTSAQAQYSVRHREVGAGTWTTVGPTSSSVSKYALPADTYTRDKSIEWQVQTKGADATFSPWSATATFDTLATIPAKYPLYLNTATGETEAVTSGGAVDIDNWESLSTQSVTTTWLKVPGFSRVGADPGYVSFASDTWTIEKPGTYLISTAVEWAAATSARRVTAIYVNGVEKTRSDTTSASTTEDTLVWAQKFIEGDQINLMVWSSGTTALSPNAPPHTVQIVPLSVTNYVSPIPPIASGGDPLPYCHAYQSVAQSITNSGATVVVTLDAEVADTHAMHDVAVSNSRVTIKKAGRYRVIATGTFAANATGIRLVAILLNGVLTAHTREVTSGSAATHVQQAVYEYDCVVGDYFEMGLGHTGSAALNTSPGPHYTHLIVSRLSSTEGGGSGGSGGGGSPVTVEDEGTAIRAGVESFNFVGPGVEVTDDPAKTGVTVMVGAGASPAAGMSPTRQVFTTVGAGTWTKPVGMAYCEVEVVSGGGAGGSTGAVPTAGQHAKGAGGGGGSYAMKRYDASELGSTESLVVGAGGQPVAVSTGGTGGTSSFGTSAAVKIEMTGGQGGLGQTGNAASFAVQGGIGGSTTTTVQDLNIQGEPGEWGWGDGGLCSSGAGGSSHFGGGGRAVNINTSSSSSAGAVGRGYGAGGSGAATSGGGGGAQLGGAGADGVVIVTEYYPAASLTETVLPSILAYRQATGTLPASPGTVTAGVVSMDAVQESEGFAALDSGQIVIPEDGLYDIRAVLSFNSPVSAMVHWGLAIDAAGGIDNTVIFDRVQTGTTALNPYTFNGSTIQRLTAGQKVGLYAYTGGGALWTTTAPSQRLRNQLQITKIPEAIGGGGGLTVCTSTTRPENPVKGDEIYETDTTKTYVWTGSAWAMVGGSGGQVIALPALTAGTWTSVSHGLSGITRLSVSFIIAATGESIDLDWKDDISAPYNSFQVMSDVAWGNATISALVQGA